MPERLSENLPDRMAENMPDEMSDRYIKKNIRRSVK